MQLPKSEHIIYALCTLVAGLLAIVAKHFINGSGPMCTVVCLRAKDSDVNIDTEERREA